jgi:hypothetical protein
MPIVCRVGAFLAVRTRTGALGDFQARRGYFRIAGAPYTRSLK